MSKSRVLIVDDEEGARGTLKAILNGQFPQYEIAGEATNVKGGHELILKTDFDILFLDVQMPDGTGFDLLQKLGDFTFEVVFITAYDEYAIRAFEYSAVGYLLKPLEIEALEKVLERISKMSQVQKQNSAEQYKVLSQFQNSSEDKIDKLVIPTVEGFEIIQLAELVRCEGERNYTRFVMQDGRSFLTSKTLKKYEELLLNKSFFRVHKSHLINLNQVVRYHKADGGSVELSDGAQIQISREKKEAFNAFFFK